MIHLRFAVSPLKILARRDPRALAKPDGGPPSSSYCGVGMAALLVVGVLFAAAGGIVSELA